MPYFFWGGLVGFCFVTGKEKGREGFKLTEDIFLEQNFFYHFCGKWVHY